MIYLTTEVGDDSEEEEQDDKGQHESDEVMEEEFDQSSSFVKDERTKHGKEPLVQSSWRGKIMPLIVEVSVQFPKISNWLSVKKLVLTATI